VEEWKAKLAEDAGKAIRHDLVVDVVDEQIDNISQFGNAPVNLLRYGLMKIALYAAQVARAQALGIDPELLRMSAGEANSEALRMAAEAVAQGIPTFLVEEGS
jgi:hypothetical protein